MSDAKYKTLKELVTAIKTKELDIPGLTLTIDNDNCSMWHYVEDENFDLTEDTLYFNCHPAKLLEDALDLLGVPFDNA